MIYSMTDLAELLADGLGRVHSRRVDRVETYGLRNKARDACVEWFSTQGVSVAQSAVPRALSDK